MYQGLYTASGGAPILSMPSFRTILSMEQSATATAAATASELPRLVAKILIIHSPTLAASRAASLSLIDTRVAPVALTGIAERVTSDEPEHLVTRISSIVDVDANHVEDPVFKPLVKNLHLRQVSNTMKHVAALARIVATPLNTTRFSLVLEDDALFGDNVVAALGYAVSDAPYDADIVFLGLPSTKQPPSNGGAVFDNALTLFGILPACDSYLITPSAAAKLSAALLPVRFPTNVQMTYALKNLGLRAYVAVPNVFVDGSKLGVFTCSVDANNRLIWNQHYCRMETIVKNVGGYNVAAGAESDAEFQRAWAEQPFKDHPDVLALKAAHLVRMGRHAEAESVYAAALQVADRNGAIITNASELLRNYIALFRVTQPMPA